MLLANGRFEPKVSDAALSTKVSFCGARSQNNIQRLIRGQLNGKVDFDIAEKHVYCAAKEREVHVNRNEVRQIFHALGVELPASIEQEILTDMAQTLEQRHRYANYPLADESLAVAFFQEKTAALAFDRVHSLPTYNLEDPVPENIAFYGATRPEMLLGAFGVVMTLLIDEGILKNDESPKTVDEVQAAENFKTTVKLVTQDIPAAIGRSPTLLFDSQRSFERSVGGSGQEVLSAAISNIALVREDDLSWEQVLDFRADNEAQVKYRRLLRWLNSEYSERSYSEIEDIIAIRLDDYQWAVKKHGLQTAVGTISCCLDPKFIGAASGALAAGALAGSAMWGALAGVAIAVGKVVVTLGQDIIRKNDNIRNHKDYEIAYIHDVQKKFGAK